MSLTQLVAIMYLQMEHPALDSTTKGDYINNLLTRSGPITRWYALWRAVHLGSYSPGCECRSYQRVKREQPHVLEIWDEGSHCNHCAAENQLQSCREIESHVWFVGRPATPYLGGGEGDRKPAALLISSTTPLQ